MSTVNELVSQSEVDSYLSCERKHYYAFGERLQVKTMGDGLTRGILGHNALEAYYKDLRKGFTPKAAGDHMLDVIKAEIMTDPLKYAEMGSKLINLLTDYVIHYGEERKEWKILAVEQEFRLNNFPFKPDLIKRHKVTGKVVLVDHKFLYNFYSETDVNLFPQLPKYIEALSQLGLHVDSAEYNMIRHRDNAQQKFKRIVVDIPDTRRKAFMSEQYKATEQILALRSIPLNRWEQSVLRTASSFNCKNCPFLDLCQADLDQQEGRDLLVKTFYEPNTYGYLYFKEGVE